MAITEFEVGEGQTAYYGFAFTHGGAPLPVTSINTLKLTFYDVRTDAIINGRDDQDILNDNDVTVDVDGVLEWAVQPEDNPIFNTKLRPGAREQHRALFVWTYNGGADVGIHQVDFLVEQIHRVP